MGPVELNWTFGYQPVQGWSGTCAPKQQAGGCGQPLTMSLINRCPGVWRWRVEEEGKKRYFLHLRSLAEALT